MTQEQKEFLIKLLSSSSVNPTAPDAAETVFMIQSIVEELKK
jgi:hypothetical protein